MDFKVIQKLLQINFAKHSGLHFQRFFRLRSLWRSPFGIKNNKQSIRINKNDQKNCQQENSIHQELLEMIIILS
ncbi:unnamed protein product [Paramecium pentaurelia]|uniref:Uncharacterized protein n=1 Tax=Paramecium pentaurelia TaxID=43138 RepID=A0A8S1UFW7_9CILI|nr:unnamed protein product [Paramecium pentaurelia]